MTAHLVRGDARHLPLASGSVQCIVTSPPYFGLRSYGGQTSVWGGDPNCPHALEDGPPLKPMTGGTGAASKKQVTNAGSQFGNAWASETRTTEQGNKRKPSDDGIDGRNRSTDKAAPKQVAISTATCTRCGAWRGELGSEGSPALFVAHLVEVMRECWRVLRDDGVAFVNMGDSYGGSGKGPTGHNGIGNQKKRQGFKDQLSAGRPKSLQLVPERIAIALSDDGWIVRSRIAWCKAAPMPESVRDRPTSAWEHVWMLTKRSTYYWDAEATKQPLQESSLERGYTYVGQPETSQKMLAAGDDVRAKANWRENGYVPTGANLRNFWVLNPDPYPGAHFATFPREIPRRCILAATSEYGACAACGAPWQRVVERSVGGQRHLSPKDATSHTARNGGGFESSRLHTQYFDQKTETTGWQPTCKCGPVAGVRPCVVLDPFSGSGTSCFVAASMGRIGIGVELSAEYTEQARLGRLAQQFLPLAPEPPAPAALAPAAPDVAPARGLGLFDSEERDGS